MLLYTPNHNAHPVAKVIPEPTPTIQEIDRTQEDQEPNRDNEDEHNESYIEMCCYACLCLWLCDLCVIN